MPAELRGPHLLLRARREEDVEERLGFGRTPEIARMFGASYEGAHSPLTRAEAMRDFEKARDNEFGWAIEHEHHSIGGIALHDVNHHDQRARLTIGIFDPAKLGIGLGREAIRLVLTYAFNEVGLHRVGLRVLEYNIRAIRCYQACGFVIEGIERQAALVDGQRYDDLMMGVLAPDFRDLRNL